MNRDKYDKVQEYLKHHKEATMQEAFDATKVSHGTYYAQKKRITTSSKRGRKITHEMIPLMPTYEESPIPQSGMVRQGMVGIVGAPEDIARLLARLSGGGT